MLRALQLSDPDDTHCREVSMMRSPVLPLVPRGVPGRAPVLAALVPVLLALGAVPVLATSMQHQDIVDLIGLSETILVGRVARVTDGFDGGVPYTEVTLDVSETVRGTPGATYTFRQFGLAAPRSLGNGLRYVGVSPDGWPRFAEGEKVVLFLYKKASKTGLRTTVGLLQGKFVERDGRVTNGIENEGLFRNISVSEDLLTPAEAKMVKAPRGALTADTFVSFVRKAVQGRWIEKKELDRVK
jgi:hypothetical protein